MAEETNESTLAPSSSLARAGMDEMQLLTIKVLRCVASFSPMMMFFNDVQLPKLALGTMGTLLGM